MEVRFWLLTLTPLLALLSYGVLLVILLRRAIRSRLHGWFACYLSVMAVWSLGSAMMRLDPGRILFWNKVLTASAMVVPLAFFGFVQAFLDEKQSRWLWVGIIVSLLGLESVNAMGLMTTEARLLEGGLLSFDTGPAIYITAIYAAFFLGLSLRLLARAYQGTRDAVVRNRIRYAVIGVLLVVLGGCTNALPALGLYPVDHAANLANALLLAYAILRYQLLDITIIVRKGLLYSIPTSVLAVGYFLIVLAAERLLQAFVGYQVLLLSIFVAAVTAVAVQPLRDRAQLWIDRLFFRESHNAQLMLQELSELTASILDIQDLTSLLLDRLTTTMHIKQAYIMLKEKENAWFHLAAQNGHMGLEDEIIFHEDHPVVQWMASHKGPLTRHDLDVLPQFKALWAQEHGDLDRLEAELFIPLVGREELIGILILGPKLSKAPYSPEEELTLSTLANQTAVATQNAWLYSDLEQSLEELRRVQAQLIQTEKLSAIGEMIAGVAHEINNPLTAVIGYSQLLQAVDLDPQVQQDLGQILTAGLRVKRIVANLLDFSRQHPPQKEYVDINQIVLGSLELRAHELMNSNIQIQTDLASGLPWTMADRYQLQQVFVNIINNAQQAMIEQGGPGVLTVRTGRGKNNSIRISFQDTGPGIPEEIMGRIFDPFFTTKEVGKGTGLGLSVSYGIVQEHEGRIWAESEAGRGATFFIELPIHHMAPAIHQGNDSMATAVEDGRLHEGRTDPSDR